ncbi:MAG: hypothetical protein Q8K79_15020 [Solirubrobacteraceae bacterium]|nr:hypothetical protein [Solirubrobacteraceae bacterium]
MPVAAQAEELIALALVFVVHVIGGAALVWALLDDEQRKGWRRRWRGGDDAPPDPRPRPPGPSGARTPPDAPPPLPLPVASPSGVRLREPGRAADGYPRPARRPEHEPQPQRAPVPARQRQRRD